MCNILASKIRAAVATVEFETFHKTSAKLIRRSIFGMDETTGKINEFFEIQKNSLRIFNVDI